MMLDRDLPSYTPIKRRAESRRGLLDPRVLLERPPLLLPPSWPDASLDIVLPPSEQHMMQRARAQDVQARVPTASVAGQSKRTCA